MNQPFWGTPILGNPQIGCIKFSKMGGLLLFAPHSLNRPWIGDLFYHQISPGSKILPCTACLILWFIMFDYGISCYVMLYYVIIMLYYVILCWICYMMFYYVIYVLLCYICYIMIYYVLLWCTMFYNVVLCFTLFYNVLCYIKLYHVILCYSMFYYVVSWYVMLCHGLLSYIMLYYV